MRLFDQAATLAGLPVHLRPRRFAHECGRGLDRRANYVAVTFAGWGRMLDVCLDRFEADAIELGASFSAKPPTKVRPNPGLVMSVPTEPIDNQGDFDAQRDAIEDAMAVVVEFRRWLTANVPLLTEWRKLIEQAGTRVPHNF